MTRAPNTSCCEKCWVFNAAYSPKLGWCGNPTCECHTAHQSSQSKGCNCEYFNMPRGHAGDKPQNADWFCPVHGNQHRDYAGTIGVDARVVAPKGESWEAEFDTQFPCDHHTAECGGDCRVKEKAFISKLLSEREEEAYRRGVVENVITLDDKLMKAFKDAREGDPLHKILQERFAAGVEAERERILVAVRALLPVADLDIRNGIWLVGQDEVCALITPPTK